MTKKVASKKPSESIEVKDQRRKSFFISDNSFIDEAARLIGPFGGAVYNSLLRHANSEGKAWPSINLIAKEWGISKTLIIRSIRKLSELNMISVDHEDGKHNIYLLLDKTEWIFNTGTCGIPVEPLTGPCETLVELETGPCETPPPVHVGHPNNTNIAIPKEIHLAGVLFEEIIKANQHSRLKAKSPREKEKTIQLWSEDIEKLIRIDKQDPVIIEQIILLATAHTNFWQRNIQSGDALRRNWDRLTSELLPKNKTVLTEKKDGNNKPGISYTISKGQWYRIEDGEQIRIDEDRVPQNIRDKIKGRKTDPPIDSRAAPIGAVIPGILTKFAVPGASDQ
jgi:hypothetical protein